MLRPVRGTKAFTLLELIVVIVILGVLAALAIPTFQKTIKKSKLEAAETTLAAVTKNAQALAGLDESGVLSYVHFEDAASELKAPSASGLLAQPLQPSSRNYHTSAGLWSFAPNARTINAYIAEGYVLYTATFLPGVGCAWAEGAGTGSVRTWSKLDVAAELCSGAAGTLDRVLSPPQTPTGLNIRFVRGTDRLDGVDGWEVSCPDPNEAVEVYRNGSWVVSGGCSIFVPGGEDDTITVIKRRVDADTSGPGGWVDGPGTHIEPWDGPEPPHRDPADPTTENPENRTFTITWSPTSIPPGTTRLELVCGSTVTVLPADATTWTGNVAGSCVLYPVDSTNTRLTPVTTTRYYAPPTPPGGGTSTPPSTTSWMAGYMDIRWNPVVATADSPLTGYRLYRQQGTGETWTAASRGFEGPAPRLADGQVQVYDAPSGASVTSDFTLSPHPTNASGIWCYRVSAYGPGGESPLSPKVCADTIDPPGAPLNVSATAGNAQVVLTWSLPAAAVGKATANGYRVTRMPGNVTQTTTGLTTTFNSLTNGTEYSFVVTSMRDETVGESAPAVTATPVAAQPVQFVAASGGSAPLSSSPYATSPDGVTWTEQGTIPGIGKFNAVEWVGDRWMMGGDNGKVASSTDGLAWTVTTALTGTTRSVNSIAGSPSTGYVAANLDAIAYSSDGVSWTMRPAGTTNSNRQRVTLKDGVWFLSGAANAPYRSTDGFATWTTPSITSGGAAYAAPAGSGVWYSVRRSGTTTTDRFWIQSLDNGVTWSQVGTARPPSSVVTKNIMTGDSGIIIYNSTSGAPVASAVSAASSVPVFGSIGSNIDPGGWDNVTDVTYRDGTWYAAGYCLCTNRVVRRSTDRINWTNASQSFTFMPQYVAARP